jgi:type II pantothenate kinase
LVKLVYFTRELDSPGNGGRLNFINFETHRIDLCIDFIKLLKEDYPKLNGAAPGELCVVATGGGAYKYYDKLKEALNVDILREDEMECLITGTLPSKELLSAFIRSSFGMVWLCKSRPRFFHHGDSE